MCPSRTFPSDRDLARAPTVPGDQASRRDRTPRPPGSVEPYRPPWSHSSGQRLAVGIGDLEDCRVLDIAHRTAGGKPPIVRIKAGKQRIEGIVQQRLVARIAIVEALCI